ncbi:RNA-directed DNA polymerase from mobile element jockey [Pitangus sulphuratus]|nr:RNA-directed DNA polymerase from mobile element jockey [Pitangus sulphuratus]
MISVILEKLWRSKDIPEDQKKANIIPIYKMSLKEDPENCRHISLTSAPEKVMQQVLLRAVTSQMKHMNGKIQDRSD